ncbi:response regulator transcription factor [Nakamurella deserti]|uniref:response regulator transcription factor n=1 Tax=Nakamurella deserti TaxID=2164074 RepID=UPI000DBE3199|nr:LuxR family transcriptional regulator [Nakamurella deserti]
MQPHAQIELSYPESAPVKILLNLVPPLIDPTDESEEAPGGVAADNLPPVVGVANGAATVPAALSVPADVRLLIIAADPAIRSDLHASLHGAELDVTHIAATVADAVDTAADSAPDIAVIVAPTGESPVAMISELRRAGIVRAVMVLSPPERISGDALVSALAAGADGWLSIDLAPSVLIRAIRGASRGEAGLSRQHVTELVAFLRRPAAATPPPDENAVASLTPRENEILVALAGQGTVKSIARQLSLSEVTVRWYTSRLLRKLGVASRFELAALAGRQGRPGDVADGGPQAPAERPVTSIPLDRPAPAEVTAVRGDGTAASVRGPRRSGTPAADAPAPAVAPNWRQLPRSEQRVVQLVVQGLTNRQIAEQLFLSKHTVDSHLKSAFTKLGVRSRVELTVLVHRTA